MVQSANATEQRVAPRQPLHGQDEQGLDVGALGDAGRAEPLRHLRPARARCGDGDYDGEDDGGRDAVGMLKQTVSMLLP